MLATLYSNNMKKTDVYGDATDLILASQKNSVPLPEFYKVCDFSLVANKAQTTYSPPHLLCPLITYSLATPLAVVLDV